MQSSQLMESKLSSRSKHQAEIINPSLQSPPIFDIDHVVFSEIPSLNTIAKKGAKNVKVNFFILPIFRSKFGSKIDAPKLNNKARKNQKLTLSVKK